jgi:hypothetical protein
MMQWPASLEEERVPVMEAAAFLCPNLGIFCWLDIGVQPTPNLRGWCQSMTAGTGAWGGSFRLPAIPVGWWVAVQFLIIIINAPESQALVAHA